MARPYATEMEHLDETFEWAKNVEIDALRAAVRVAATLPLQAIGSGGSLTAAHALVYLHQHLAGRLATVSTPLEAVSEQLGGLSHWLISAGGRNVDIVAAAKTLLLYEPKQLTAMCGRLDSPLSDLCHSHPYSDLLVFPPPAGKDGFLATNSLLGFVALLTRAYALEFGDGDLWDHCASEVSSLLQSSASSAFSWRSETDGLWPRSTTLVVHGPTTKVGAIDLESKFTEAALGNLQIADYRNFAHGRHHWLAKRGEASAILAFISDDDRELAHRTLALIPDGIPIATISLSGRPAAAMLSSLVAALRITEWAGIARGIDPGRPGVPDFGRKLYNLPLPRPRPKTMPVALSPREEAAIRRKAGKPAASMHRDELIRWKKAAIAFRSQLVGKDFSAICFDYDGTLVDTRHRFHRPIERVKDEIVRLIESGGRVAIATGRGASVGRDLRDTLPKQYWNDILVGYYNGADIALLAEPTAPDGTAACCPELAPLAAALRTHPELGEWAKQTDRPFQITLETEGAVPEGRLWDLAYQVIIAAGASGVKVTRSSHSVDIVAAAVSKLNVVQRLQQEVGGGSVLAIGDRGRWPGNDHELLDSVDSLSVDETSVDPARCWNFASGGQRGVEATLEYLQLLVMRNGRLRFEEGAFV
ncbi:HAD hydrolase family protein [Phyllobacterium chamaecytisi]|uniref:HAD hydrolase family protein n=1 Tax=Phyllobacterium chamaecytisi TaxID=2876082 RepID=UPI001CCAD64B|nr:HAD hydrolase family protein [Phyllobacterium sp. KW56]MBZ9603308.1 HAD hydrolase family protein [Phyllobacterium sp. KW56]